MTDDRLSLAVDAGLFQWPDAPVFFFGAGGSSLPSGLPRDHVVVVENWKPAHDQAQEAGHEVATEPPGRAGLSIVAVPRSKDLARARVAEAARVTDGPVVIDGQKTDGIEGLLKELRRRGELSEALSKHHGKLAVLAPGADLSGWEDPGPRITDGFMTRIGVFSADGPDPGSVLLADALPGRLGPRVADLGAGWGYLSRAVLARDGVEELHLVEADLRALDCARANVHDPRARFHWADATRFADPGGFHSVVMNPPFHQGRAGDPGLGIRFIETAATLLARGGAVYLVANRHLPYERALAARFGELTEIGGDRSYKLFRAARPKGPGPR